MFPTPYLDKIYKYIRRHDGDIILMYEMEKELCITQPTIRKYLKWLVDRNLIRRWKKRIWIVPI